VLELLIRKELLASRELLYFVELIRYVDCFSDSNSPDTDSELCKY